MQAGMSADSGGAELSGGSASSGSALRRSGRIPKRKLAPDGEVLYSPPVYRARTTRSKASSSLVDSTATPSVSGPLPSRSIDLSVAGVQAAGGHRNVVAVFL